MRRIPHRSAFSQPPPSGLPSGWPTLPASALWLPHPPWPSRPPRPPRPPSAPPRILVVEDDRALRDVLRLALADAGWEIATAGNGQHGLTQLAAGPFDAVVLDVGLPDIDGVALCRRLRRAGNLVPVIMVSARAEIDQRIGGLDAGADDYLPKPFDLGELRARVRANPAVRTLSAGG
jgi:CheY-like chemotaxis protein